ncbi:hypothetical protein Tco_0218112 [Tanacetum coccineum]
MTRAKTIEHTTSLIAKNDDFKAQLQEKVFAIATLKNELRKLTGNSVNTKFAKSSILGKPVLQSLRNQSVIRQPTAFKSERPRISKPRFASQVDVNNDLSKPVTTYYLPRERESAFAKPHHMIAPSSSRYSSNGMVHNHYLEEAKKKTQEISKNSEPSVMPSVRLESTANGSKPKPRINNQKYKNWPTSKHSCVTTKIVPISEHSRNFRNFSDSKYFVCSTCQKCLFNANHDSCVTKFLNKVNSRAKVPSNKTTNRNKPVEQTSVAKKPERQIQKGHRFSIKKTSVVHEKTITPRSCLRWKLTGKIFKTVGLRWVPTRKIFISSTTKVDSEPTNGSNENITNQYECEQTLNVSACTLNLSAGTSFNPKKEGLRVCSELRIHDRSKLVPKVVPPADKTATSRQELELLFHHHITMLSSQAVNKSPTHYPCDSARTFRVILFSIHNDEWKSFQCHHQTALRELILGLPTKKDAERPAISFLTLKPLLIIDPKDKGKWVLEEEPKPVKVKSKDQGEAQIERDAEIALKVQAELDEEARLERQRQEQASLNYIANLYDEVQARIDADHELAVRWTQEEQEKYTVDERAKLLAEYFENRKKQLAEERAAAIRNKPPTKSQLRSLMMTYLKHTGRYKHAQLNKKTLEEIQMNKMVAGVHEEKVLEEPGSTKVEVKQEGNKESTRKRPGRRLKMKETKKSRMQKTDSDLEEEEHLKTFLKIVPDEEGIIDYEVLEKRFPITN